MSFGLAVRRASLIARFACRHPCRLLTTPVPALLTDRRLSRWRKQGFKILIVSIDDAGYLPFVLPFWRRLPDGFEKKVKIFVTGRPLALAEIAEAFTSLQPAPAGYFSNWETSLIRNYDLFLTTHQSAIAPIFGKNPRVCTFHGLPAKGGTFVERQWRFLDGAFGIGPLQKRLFEDFYNSSAVDRTLWYLDVGYPKSDALVNGLYHRNEILADLELDPETKTVLYAPSWEKGTSLYTHGQEIATQLLAQNLNVIVKLHPMSYYPVSEKAATGGINWGRAFDHLESAPRFRHVKGGDVTPLVAATDILVTDVSSVAFEGVLADRPIIFFDTPDFFDHVVPDMYDVTPEQARSDVRYNCGRDAGLVVKTMEQLLDAVRRFCADPSLLEKARSTIRAQLLFNPGRSSQVTADAICELLQLGSDIPTGGRTPI